MSEKSANINGLSAVGRPLFNGKNKTYVLQKLEEAFMLGSTDEEACIYADISSSAFYEYQKKNPSFLERKKALKNLPTLRARKTVVDKLSKDVGLAKWWLERRRPDEFGVRREEVGVSHLEINLGEEAAKRATKYRDEALG